MDLSDPVRAIIPSLEGEVYRVLARTISALPSARIAAIAAGGSRQGIRLALERLVHQGTVLASQTGSTVLYSANRDHLLWPAIESAVRSADQTLPDLKARLSALAAAHADGRREQQVTLALYGSVARGSSTADSDIDIVAVFPTPGITEHDEAFLDEVIAQVPRWTGNACNVYPITREGLADLVDREDSMIASWRSDADTFFGPDLQTLLRPRDLRSRAS